MQTTSHIIQSHEWAEFKTAYGTSMVQLGEIYYSKHKIPFSPYFVAYCPKVNPFFIDWEKLPKSLKSEGCVSINFDVPNVDKTAAEAAGAMSTLQTRCDKSPKNTFAHHTVFVDLTGTEDEILGRMHNKHRYNIRIAQKRGVTTRLAENLQDYDLFYNMLQETSVREKYYIHSRVYYLKLWEILKPLGMCEIMIAECEGKALSAWVLFFNQKTVYYPYGGTANLEERNFYNPGNLIGWDAIKLGRSRGCEIFDMWGATGNLNDTTDPWWGFTNFKIKFGGQLVEFIDSYDYVINAEIYKMFNLANKLRWKFLKLIR
jgi:lipid II:glycine glycyltransferase (peptidoglycan interpeptide bridge formation enzyme)